MFCDIEMKHWLSLKSSLSPGCAYHAKNSISQVLQGAVDLGGDASWGLSTSFIISGVRYDSRPLNATKSNHLYCDLWKKTEGERTWTDWAGSQCSEPHTSEAHAVWRECGQVSALLQFIPLWMHRGTLCLGMTLPNFHTSCNHVHFAFHTSWL